MKSANPTFDADTGTPVTADIPVTPSPMNGTSTIPSVINIPPQIAVTVCWIALGFAICWYLTRPKRHGSGILG
jgi:hypothetical protein